MRLTSGWQPHFTMIESIVAFKLWLVGASGWPAHRNTPASQSPISEEVTGRSLQAPWAVGAGRRGLSTAPRETIGSPRLATHADEVFAPRTLADSLEGRYEQKR